MARDWYIAEGGDDGNPGSVSQPRLTFPSDDGTITTGDVFYLSGNIRSRLVVADKVVHVRQWPGQTQAVIRGDTVVAASGWAAAGNGWSKSIGAGKELNNTSTANDAGTEDLGTVVFNWDTKITTNAARPGQHYGHLTYDTAANVQAASGATTGKYHYSTATGLLTIFVGGADPNSTGVVAYCDTEGTDAISITNGSGSTVEGVNFALWPSAGGFGYAIKFATCTGTAKTIGRNCIAYDCGYHAFGGVTKAKNVEFDNCDAIGLWRGGTHFVFHSDDNGSTVTGCRMQDCTAVMGRFRNFDDSGIPTGINACGQYALTAHGPGGGTPVSDVLATDTIIYIGEVAVGQDPCSVADTAAPSNAWDWKTYPVRLDGGRVYNGTKWAAAGYIAVRRMYLDYANAGAAAPSEAAFTYNTTTAWTMLYDSCEIIADGDGQAFFVTAAVFATGHDLRFLNCSIYEEGTETGEFHCLFQWNFRNDAHIRCRGCIIGQATAGNNIFALNDNTTDAAHHDFTDNAYYFPHGDSNWSGNSSFDTAAEWGASIDTSMRVLTANPFTQAPTNLSLTPTSNLWAVRRATHAIVPTASINGMGYAGMYGPYQHPQACITFVRGKNRNRPR